MRCFSLTLLAIMILMVFAVPVYAAIDLNVDMFDPSAILEDIDGTVSSIIVTIRVLAAIATVLLAISIGFTLLMSKDSYALQEVKTRMVFFVVGLFVIFTTEYIVRFIFSVIMP